MVSMLYPVWRFIAFLDIYFFWATDQPFKDLRILIVLFADIVMLWSGFKLYKTAEGIEHMASHPSFRDMSDSEDFEIASTRGKQKGIKMMKWAGILFMAQFFSFLISRTVNAL